MDVQHAWYFPRSGPRFLRPDFHQLPCVYSPARIAGDPGVGLDDHLRGGVDVELLEQIQRDPIGSGR